ncbi:hypothetical protein ATANTOWER_027444 [Ataeniobius toweri]|uniref:Uncharacterized protein n=1 Tax=Ataeniobius toweri TaxID=208326 RepID=A0ABU7AS54_9TELE|nr:hypothetical protein [Ataeniobius toweri]
MFAKFKKLFKIVAETKLNFKNVKLSLYLKCRSAVIHSFSHVLTVRKDIVVLPQHKTTCNHESVRCVNMISKLWCHSSMSVCASGNIYCSIEAMSHRCKLKTLQCIAQLLKIQDLLCKQPECARTCIFYLPVTFLFPLSH